MSYFGAKDFALEVALGNVEGYSKVNKFGEAPDCDNGAPTDVWDGADGSTSTDIWVAPTQARIHDIASSSGNDAAAGTGMQTCRVYGLFDWDAAEDSEIITLNGAANVPTVNSYVIIHRIVGLTFGSGGTNAGIVTATAQTDATVTAAVQAGNGQTLMAIYGVPSTQTIHLTYGDCGTLRGVSGARVDGALLVKENADQATAGYVTKHEFEAEDAATWRRPWAIPKSFSGPCIVKIQVESDTNNTKCTGSFDAYVVDN